MTTLFGISSTWKSLPYPFPSSMVPLMISDNEFIVFSDKLEGHAIFTFNIKSCKWSKILDCADWYSDFVGSWTFNKQENIIYMCASLDFVNDACSLDLNTKNMNKIAAKLAFESTLPSRMIYINNKIHAITGQNYTQDLETKHYIHDLETKQNKIVYEFEEFKHGMQGAGFIYLKCRKSIILIGGYKTRLSSSGSIYTYSLMSNEWNKLNVKLPLKLSHFAIVSTRFDQYVIMLGGWVDGLNACDDIYVFDIKHLKFMKSEIKCPSSGYTEAVIIDNTYNDEVLTFGFVNTCFKSKQFDGIQALPYYLIQLISKWVCNQNIHLIQSDNHWTIGVDDIIHACNKII